MRRLTILCRCQNYQLLPPAELENVRTQIPASELLEVDDLCQLAMNSQDNEPLKQKLRDHQLTIAACHPRAVKSLLTYILGPNHESLINQTTLIDLRPTEPPTTPKPTSPASISGNQGWFPVIDYDRCTHCHACLNFCLFGVYATSPTGQLTVTNPQACKPDCPACARVCPSLAIIFPKHPHPPINGAALTPDNPPTPEKIDISNLLGGDIYHKLKKRQRFSTNPADTTTREQKMAKLLAMKETLGIPDHVLTNLQTPDHQNQHNHQSRDRQGAVEPPKTSEPGGHL